MVGDNSVFDIEGGRAAEMTTILVQTKKECPYDFFCEAPADIPKVLN